MVRSRNILPADRGSSSPASAIGRQIKGKGLENFAFRMLLFRMDRFGIHLRIFPVRLLAGFLLRHGRNAVGDVIQQNDPRDPFLSEEVGGKRLLFLKNGNQNVSQVQYFFL